LSDLNIETPLPEESDNHEESTSSRSLLVTMVLMIAGFILTGTMMMHYATKRGGGTAGMKSPVFNIAGLMEKGKAYQAHRKESKAAKPDIQADTQEKSLGKLFSQRREKVRWPKLNLTGFGSTTDGTGGFAIINGDHVHPGQLIGGKVTLKEVRSFDVIVEYMGEQKTLTVKIEN